MCWVWACAGTQAALAAPDGGSLESNRAPQGLWPRQVTATPTGHRRTYTLPRAPLSTRSLKGNTSAAHREVVLQSTDEGRVLVRYVSALPWDGVAPSFALAAGLEDVQGGPDEVTPLSVVVSSDVVLWAARSVAERGLVALEDEAWEAHRSLWAAVATHAAELASEGPLAVRDGALEIAARAALAVSCGDPGAVVDELHLPADVGYAAQLRWASWRGQRWVDEVPEPWARTQRARCLYLLRRSLGQPLTKQNMVMAPALVLRNLLASDEQLWARWKNLKEYRATLWVDAAVEPLFDPAFDAPPMFAFPQRAIDRFLSSLRDDEYARAYDELAYALEDGRVAPAAGSISASELKVAAAWVAPFRDGFGAEGRWRERMWGAVASWLGGGRDWAVWPPSKLEVPPRTRPSSPQLLVAPVVPVEPVAAVYERGAEWMHHLGDIISQRLPPTATGWDEGGRASRTPLAKDARLWELRLQGLTALTSGNSTRPTTTKSAAASDAAKAYLASWRSDAGANLDLRRASVGAGVHDGQRVHTLVVGAALLRMELRYERPPQMQVLASLLAPDAVSPDGTAATVVGLPAVVAIVALAPEQRPPLRRDEVVELIESHGPSLTGIEAAFAEALVHAPTAK